MFDEARSSVTLALAHVLAGWCDVESDDLGQAREVKNNFVHPGHPMQIYSRLSLGPLRASVGFSEAGRRKPDL